MSHRSNSNRGATASAEARLQDISATLRRERDDAYRQAALATERFTAIQEEEVALIKTVSDMQAKLATLQQQAGGAVQAEIETAKGQVQTLNQQVDFQHAALVQKRQLLQGLQSSRDDVMKSYQGSVKIMQSLIHERKARLAATQQVYAVQTVVVQQQPAAAMGTLDNTSGAVASVPNANAVHDTVLQVELLDPLYQNTLWDQKWPRLVQAVATKVQQQGAALQSTNAVQDRVVQGYLQHFGWQQLATGEDDAASDDAVSDKWKDNRPIVHAFNIPHANAWMDADQDNAAVVQEGAGGAINTTAALGEVTNTHKVSCDAEQGSVLPDTSTPEHITKSAVSTTVVAETAVALEPTQE